MMTRPRLWLLPLEPLEERYTGAWFRWLPEFFGQAYDVHSLHGSALSEGVRVGAFLDLFSSAHYKATQLAAVASLFDRGRVKPGDTFFVSDIEFPGMEQIRYLSRLSGVPVKIFGTLQAGSYTRGDFMEPMADIGQHAELAWVMACDRVFVGSAYHRDAFLDRRAKLCGAAVVEACASRFCVSGNPWRTLEARALAEGAPEGRSIDVLFPHRPDREKGIGEMLSVLPALLRRGLRVAFTTGRASYRSTNAPELAAEVEALAAEGKVELHTGLTRQAFYRVLRRARVVPSFTTEENYGYAIVEAMAQGALPLLRHAASYPELVQGAPAFLFPDADSFLPMLDRLLGMSEPPDPVALARRLDTAEAIMLDVMLNTPPSGGL